MSNSIFKLGLDVHGVVDSMPEFFSFLSESFIKNGAEVHIITGGSWTNELQNQLKSYGIKWTHYFSVYDYMMGNNYSYSGEITFSDGTVQKRFSDSEWNKVKADYCSKNNISLHIDDKVVYNNSFETPFCKLWLNKN
jgi:hypothetical protein